jgi:sialidase-1
MKFYVSPVRVVFQILCLVLLAGCVSSNRTERSGSGKIFETMLAPATATHPRQSEGDIIVLKDGTLLAAWTDFSGGGQDHSSAVISAAKSKDEGRTWSAPFVLQENIGKQNVMSVSFLRLRSGEILFFFLVKNSATDLKVTMRRSLDGAKTWTEPMIVTPGPGYHIMNNARVIQLKSGRILCPISFDDDISKRRWNLRNFIYFSDDNGRTWRRSKDIVECEKRGAMEPGLVELKNGNVLQIIRTELGQIWHSISPDGGDRWSKSAPYGIVSPESPSTVARMPDGKLLLIYNPALGANQMKARTPLVASWSGDEGKTWSIPKVIEASADSTYAYTSITFHRNRALLTYYFAPIGTNKMSLKFKSIPLNWFHTE